MRIRLAPAILVSLLVLSPALAQTQSGKQPADAPVALAPEPLRLDAVGLSVNLPEGAIAQTSRVGDRVSVQVSPASTASDWFITIQTPQSSSTTTTAHAVAAEVLDQLLRSVGVLNRAVDHRGQLTETMVSTRGVVLEQVKDIHVAADASDHSRPAARFYVKLPGADKQPDIVRGYTVFQVEPGRFVTFDLATTEPAFARTRPIYETSVATARFVDAGVLAAARGAIVESGIASFAKLTPADYDATIAQLKDQWFRLSKRAPGASDADAQEIAYRHLRAWKGARGELDPARSPARYSAADRQQGYLVRIDARYLEEGKVIDTVGVYFMSPDRKDEAWTLQMVVRDPDRRKPATWTETGARAGASMSVTVAGDGVESKAVQPTVPDQGYINQVETFLLPQLLLRAGGSGEFGFYSYQSAFEKVLLRRDTMTEPASRPGTRMLTTILSEDRDPQVSIYNDRGDLIQTTLPADVKGQIPAWTPITLTRLVEIWRAKNLPMN